MASMALLSSSECSQEGSLLRLNIAFIDKAWFSIFAIKWTI
jgi:hypothetical protein